MLGDTPNASARALSAPVPYDQLSGFHLVLVVAMVLKTGGERQEESEGNIEGSNKGTCY